MADHHLSALAEEVWVSEGERMLSPKRQGRDPVHKFEHTDINTAPLEDESDDCYSPSIKPHEERL